MIAMIAGMLLTTAALDTAKDVKPEMVKIPDLIAKIKAEKGKVVVVDFWSDG